MSVTSIMAESEHLRESQDLFELYVSDYIMLTRCKVSPAAELHRTLPPVGCAIQAVAVPRMLWELCL